SGQYTQATGGCVLTVGSRREPATISANLYATLREFDALGVDVIMAEAIDPGGIGTAVMNRLTKAATRVVEV
ncbi:MAG TPA: Sua5 family C-terminal domain-containing protein, partial [Bacillota bacterium]|nr:Sua5 family C-terminal domain-containing protein [Bacillota bacterium]